MKGAAKLAGGLLIGLLGGFAEARAQDAVLEVVNEGKPEAGVEVLLMVNSGKVDLGSTDAGSELIVATDRDDLPDGTPVDVYAIDCDDVVVIVVVAPGEQEAYEEECERRRRENPNCTCRRIGGFLWGDDVTIDIGRDDSRTTETATYGGSLVQIGGGVGWSRWPHLDRACDLPGVVDCDLQDGIATFRGGVEWYPRSRFGLALDIGYNPGLEVDHQSFQAGGGFPSSSVTELDVLGAGLMGVVRQPFGDDRKHAVFGAFGPWWLFNLGTVTTDFGSAGIFEESRHDPGLRLGGRAGLDWGLGDGRWASRFEVGGMTGEEHDIDASWYFGLLFMLRLGTIGLVQ